jgi:hypothetical protein
MTARDAAILPSALATKEIFIGNNRVAAQMVNGPTSMNTAANPSNPTSSALWIGSWGVSIATGNTDAINFGSPGNFITIDQNNTQVLGEPQEWTKANQVLGTVNTNQALTLQNPKPQGGYYEVSYTGQTGYARSTRPRLRISPASKWMNTASPSPSRP